MIIMIAKGKHLAPLLRISFNVKVPRRTLCRSAGTGLIGIGLAPSRRTNFL